MTPSKNISSENLIAEFKMGNEAALSYIYDSYSGALLGILVQVVGDTEMSKDLLQDVFVKIWKHRDKFDENKGTLYTWMLNLTRNTGIDYLRSKRNKNNQQNRKLDDIVYGLEGKDSFNPDHIGVRDILNDLPEEQREVITLSYFKGFTQKEISEEYNIPLGTVKSRVKAGMDKLRKVLKTRDL